jgi:hypothetical protein
MEFFTSICGAKGPFLAAAAMVEVLVLTFNSMESVLNPLYVAGLNFYTNNGARLE